MLLFQSFLWWKFVNDSQYLVWFLFLKIWSYSNSTAKNRLFFFNVKENGNRNNQLIDLTVKIFLLKIEWLKLRQIIIFLLLLDSLEFSYSRLFRWVFNFLRRTSSMSMIGYKKKCDSYDLSRTRNDDSNNKKKLIPGIVIVICFWTSER